MGNTTNNGKHGGLLFGKSHDEGGIKAIVTDTGQHVELESKELIVNKNTAQSNKKYEFEGKLMRPYDIISALNHAGGGVSFPNAKNFKIAKMKSGGEIKGKNFIFNANEYIEYENHRFNISKIYELILAEEISPIIKKIKLADIKNLMTGIEKEIMKQHAGKKNSVKNIMGVILAIDIDGKKQYLLIDGNHRTQRALKQQRKNGTFIIIDNPEDIKKIYENTDITKPPLFKNNKKLELGEQIIDSTTTLYWDNILPVQQQKQRILKLKQKYISKMSCSGIIDKQRIRLLNIKQKFAN